MAEGKTIILIFMIGFWTIMTILSSYFEVEISRTHISELTPQDENLVYEEKSTANFFTNIFNTVDDVPIVKHFVPLFKMLTWQYVDEIPPYVSLILDMFAILTVFVFVIIFKGES